MSSNLPYKLAANVERRTWDKEVYEARAKARNEAAEAAAAGGLSSHSRGAAAATGKRPIDDAAGAATAVGAAGSAAAINDEAEKEEFVPAARGAAGPERSQRAYLKARKSKVDLESKLGTSEFINPDAVANSGGAATEAGAVSITDGVTKSSTGVGWHCKVCDCFLKDSMTYLDHINGRKHQRYLGYSMRVEKSTKSQVTSKLLALAEEKRKAEVAAAAQEVNPADDEGNEFEEAVKRKDEEALKRKTERARRREERKKKEQENEEEEEEELSGGLDPAMAAMMGFTGFGGSNRK